MPKEAKTLRHARSLSRDPSNNPVFMHTCMCMCVYVCVCVCEKKYMHACVLLCVRLYSRLPGFVHACVYLCVCVYVCVHMRACMHTCACACLRDFDFIVLRQGGTSLAPPVVKSQICEPSAVRRRTQNLSPPSRSEGRRFVSPPPYGGGLTICEFSHKN